MDRNELLLDPRHLGVPSDASKMISEPVVRSVQTMHLSCVETNTMSKWTKTSFHYLGVPFWCAQSDFHAHGTFGANRAPILRRDKHYLQMDRNELALDQH